jgi:membrane-associated HD superfamily phosphohydrolase
MPPQRLMRSFLFLWLVTGVVLLVGSLETVNSALRSSAHANPHLVVLGSVEALAAALFLVPRSMRVGAIGLLVTIFTAFAVHTALHEFRGDLLLYAATVSFIVIHGPLTREQLQHTISSRPA